MWIAADSADGVPIQSLSDHQVILVDAYDPWANLPVPMSSKRGRPPLRRVLLASVAAFAAAFAATLTAVLTLRA
jgi:hypothetical protein